jgi:hypothetical protein
LSRGLGDVYKRQSSFGERIINNPNSGLNNYI